MKFKAKPTKIIKKSPLDEEFRHEILSFIKKVKKEAIIITGEGQAFEYLELRMAVRDAIERGVVFKIYAHSPERRILLTNKILSYGAEVYKGAEGTKDHFFVIDGTSFIVSKAHPPDTIGERMADVYENDPEDAKEIIKFFEKLIARSSLVKIRPEEDPLEKKPLLLYE